MLALRKTQASFGLSLDTIDHPAAPGADEVLIQVAAVGICGSDVHVYEWTDGYAFMKDRLPVVLGHEFSGTVRTTGESVHHLKPGTSVAVMPGISCMRCDACLGGSLAYCTEREVIGLTRDGAFASYVVVPAKACIPLPENIDLKLAALLEPLCVGANAAEVGEIKAGDTVVVLGPGTIGQAVIRNALWCGATQVIAVGKNDAARLHTAQQVGATHTIDLDQADSLAQHIHRITGGKLADVVIEASGHHSSINDGLRILRQGGILVIAGIHAQPVQIDLTPFVRNKQQIRGAHSSQRHHWEHMIKRLATSPNDVSPMISLELPLEKSIEAFEQCLTRNHSKVLLCP